MAIKMVRQPSSAYRVKSGTHYYAEDDIDLAVSIGTTKQDLYASLENLVYGKIVIDNTNYLVSTKDMQMIENTKNYNSISNVDDIVGLRYAYGNQDGYVKDKGNELGYSVDGSNFKVLSGRVVLQGVESDVDANGVTLTIDNVSELRYYTVYYQVNMATNETNILLSNYDTATYPVIDKGDDLTANTIGIANLELYRFQAQNGIISGVEKVVNRINYINTGITVENSKRVNGLDIKQENDGILYNNNFVIPQRNVLVRALERRFDSSSPQVVALKHDPFEWNILERFEVRVSVLLEDPSGAGSVINPGKEWYDLIFTIMADRRINLNSFRDVFDEMSECYPVYIGSAENRKCLVLVALIDIPNKNILFKYVKDITNDKTYAGSVQDIYHIIQKNYYPVVVGS